MGNAASRRWLVRGPGSSQHELHHLRLPAGRMSRLSGGRQRMHWRANPAPRPTPDAGQCMTATQPDNPLHGITLEMILNKLVACQGWDELGRQVDIRCFKHEPSVASSLKFLRRTPWALSLIHISEPTRRTPISYA